MHHGSHVRVERVIVKSLILFQSLVFAAVVLYNLKKSKLHAANANKNKLREQWGALRRNILRSRTKSRKGNCKV